MQGWDLGLIEQPAEVLGTQHSLPHIEQCLVPETDLHAHIMKQLDLLVLERVKKDGVQQECTPWEKGKEKVST